MATKFIRCIETWQAKNGRCVKKIVIRPKIQNCTGIFWCTDIQVQESGTLTGYTPHTSEMLRYSPVSPRFHNGVVRGNMTVIIPNTGGVAAGFDCYIYPLQDMDAKSVMLSQGEGSHTAVFVDGVKAGDELALLAGTRRCLKNGINTRKNGFFQYSAAYDSKHHVSLKSGKSARVCFDYRETQNGGYLL